MRLRFPALVAVLALGVGLAASAEATHGQGRPGRRHGRLLETRRGAGRSGQGSTVIWTKNLRPEIVELDHQRSAVINHVPS
jgi:hypothetical protein